MCATFGRYNEVTDASEGLVSVRPAAAAAAALAATTQAYACRSSVTAVV